MAEKDSRAQIMAAAKKRFAHFGYGKTSMADIAGDCAMSPGNLYRFFPGKLDIAEAIATADFENHLDHLRRQIARPGRQAREKLRDFLLESLRRTYNKVEKDPRAVEMAQVIAAERPEFAGWMLDSERQIMAGVIEEAQRQGEFMNADGNSIAALIQSATMKFRYPQLWSRLTLSKLEQELSGVLKLLMDGIHPPVPARSRNPEIA